MAYEDKDDELKQLLEEKGDYTVWRSATDNPVLSIREDDTIVHHPIYKYLENWDHDKCTQGHSFPTIQSFVGRLCDESANDLWQSSLKRFFVEKNWVVKEREITKKEKIGTGHFSNVYKAEYKGKVVAMKEYQQIRESENGKRFRLEAFILGQINHRNIIKFIGIVADQELNKIVTEYVGGGDLLEFLQNSKFLQKSEFLQNPGNTLSEKESISLCKDVSSGMAYLESMKCIHRDLAARNCLVEITDRYTVKISDFGLSRLEGQCSLSDDDPIPVKWAAPEVLNGELFTSKSDVWSFGILMWEVFSKGKTPYHDIVFTGCEDFYNILVKGEREKPPAKTPDECETLMRKCWEFSPNDRDDFKTIDLSFDFFYKKDSSFQLSANPSLFPKSN